MNVIDLLRRAMVLVCGLALGGCTVATPFRGPGYDASQSETEAGQVKVTVALTHAVLNGDKAARDEFWKQVKNVERSLPGQAGFVGYSKRAELLGDQAWTMTVWRDEGSMRAFVHGDVHKAAIREGYGALESVRFARFEIAPQDLPLSWSRALELLDRHARNLDESKSRPYETRAHKAVQPIVATSTTDLPR